MRILSSIHGGALAAVLLTCSLCFGEETPGTPKAEEPLPYLVSDKVNDNTERIVDFGIQYLCRALVYALMDNDDPIDPQKDLLGVKLYMNKPLKATPTEGLPDEIRKQVLDLVALCEKVEADREADEETKKGYLKEISDAEQVLFRQCAENGVIFSKIPDVYGTNIYNKVENLQKLGLDADTDEKKDAMAQEVYRALIIAGQWKYGQAQDVADGDTTGEKEMPATGEAREADKDAGKEKKEDE